MKKLALTIALCVMFVFVISPKIWAADITMANASVTGTVAKYAAIEVTQDPEFNFDGAAHAAETLQLSVDGAFNVETNTDVNVKVEASSPTLTYNTDPGSAIDLKVGLNELCTITEVSQNFVKDIGKLAYNLYGLNLNPITISGQRAIVVLTFLSLSQKFNKISFIIIEVFKKIRQNS